MALITMSQADAENEIGVELEGDGAAPELQRALELEREQTRYLSHRVRELESAANQLETYAADLSRTYGEMRRHLQHMTVLHEAQIRISSGLDPDAVASNLLTSIAKLLDQGEATVYLVEPREITERDEAPNREDALPRRWARLPRMDASVELDESRPTPARSSSVTQAIRQARTTSRAVRGGPNPIHELAIPLRAGGRCVGALELVLPGSQPLEEEITVLELLAAAAGVALQNAYLYQETQRLAVTDPLTGLANHRQFHELLALEVDRARRMGYPVGFLMMDLDHFKLVNDRYFHPTGNAVLRQVADVIRRRLRRTDVIGRLGGEEFGAVLSGASNEEVKLVGEELRRAVEDLPPVGAGVADGEPPFHLTMSVGGASMSADELEPEKLEQCADRALYEAKRAGRNRFQLWMSPEVEAS